MSVNFVRLRHQVIFLYCRRLMPVGSAAVYLSAVFIELHKCVYSCSPLVGKGFTTLTIHYEYLDTAVREDAANVHRIFYTSK